MKPTNVSSPCSKMSSYLKTWLEMNDCEAFVMHEEKCLIGVRIRFVLQLDQRGSLITIVALKISNPLVHSETGWLDFIQITAGNIRKEEWSECISKIQKWTRSKICIIYVSMCNISMKYGPYYLSNVIWTKSNVSFEQFYSRKKKEEEDKLFQKDFQSDLFVKRFVSSELKGYDSSQEFYLLKTYII